MPDFPPGNRDTPVLGAFEDLRTRHIEDFYSIGLVLDELESRPLARAPDEAPFLAQVARGLVFVTFAYGIDGVSMEIAKYGSALTALLREEGHQPAMHCVGGNFQNGTDVVIPSDWRRIVLDNADGWDKWEEGKWFAQLFFEDMPEGSALSRNTAATVWLEAVRMAEELVALLTPAGIGLLIPVNVNSNPGNFALALAMVLVSEVTGCPVLNSNHDFYWEGGSPTTERPGDHQAGPRDHFFHNHENRGFFDLFRRILPWDGRRSIQVNINPLQSARLVDEGFAEDRVFLVGTGIEEGFFDLCSPRQKQEYRRRMAHILSDGRPTVAAAAVKDFLEHTTVWMGDQHPVVCGLREGTELDLASTETLVLLQPTRVVPRKRIPRDWQLIGALLHHPPFRNEIERRTDIALVLLITGPVPIEHRSDAEEVLHAFADVLDSVPESIGRRLFQAFSVGHQRHASLVEGLEVFDIYHSADMVLFPSETEGRGLPIPESAAAGIPIVCSRYDPISVFDEVVGAHLPEDQRLQYLGFPESEFDEGLLDEISAMLLDPTSFADRSAHNRDAARSRFSLSDLQHSFAEYLRRLESIHGR